MALKIGIIGLGFVGNAIYQTLIQFKHLTIIGYDKYKNNGQPLGNINDIQDCQFTFLCLPTLFNEITREYNLEPLHQVCSQLKSMNYQGICLIKSTVEPETSEKFATKYNLKIIHNPEFLTARSAQQDFANQSHIVLGKTSHCNNDQDLDLIISFYQTYFPNAKISVTNSIESESMKLFVNNFYAVKVQMFTEFYQLCQKNGANYNNIKDLMLNNGWIANHHVNIPGPDGQISYGGLCFPKDTNALLAYMQKYNSDHAVLQACINERNQMRDD